MKTILVLYSNCLFQSVLNCITVVKNLLLTRQSYEYTATSKHCKSAVRKLTRCFTFHGSLHHSFLGHKKIFPENILYKAFGNYKSETMKQKLTIYQTVHIYIALFKLIFKYYYTLHISALCLPPTSPVDWQWLATSVCSNYSILLRIEYLHTLRR